MEYVLAGLLLLLIALSIINRQPPAPEPEEKDELLQDSDVMIDPPARRNVKVTFEKIATPDGGNADDVVVVIRSGYPVVIVPRLHEGNEPEPERDGKNLLVRAPKDRNMRVSFELVDGAGNDITVHVQHDNDIDVYLTETYLSSDGELDEPEPETEPTPPEAVVTDVPPLDRQPKDAVQQD